MSAPRVGAQDGPIGASFSHERQAGVRSASNDASKGAFAALQPEVARWPGWMRLVFLIGAGALSWGVVIGIAMLYASDRGRPPPWSAHTRQGTGREKSARVWLGRLFYRRPIG